MKLDYKKTMFVGFAFFLICLFWQAYDSLIPKILTDKFGMNQAWSGFIMALDNILALFLLPLFGGISDKCKSRFGKRTPFIVVGTVLAAILFVLLSLVDLEQKNNLSAVAIDNPSAQETLYKADLTIRTPDGETVKISEKFTMDQFVSIGMEEEIDGVTKTSADYINYVVPARQVYAAGVTKEHPASLVKFMIILVFVLISMSIFRSPAVALMPDVTIKPLRSKANAVINLMGTFGGVTLLVLGTVFGTGKAANALMSYTTIMGVTSAIMIISLLLFLSYVREPKMVAQMHDEEKKFGLTDEKEDVNGERKLTKEERASLLLILASVVLWYFGYNAVTSKYSVYAGTVLNVDYNLTLMIAQVAAIISYFPVGILSSKIGRKKTILMGVVLLAVAFGTASFLRAGAPAMVMNILFSVAGIGWASINVNSYPMVVELATGGNVGKYTGFYYTASMAAQTVTPIFSGLLMDVKMTTLFPYATIFVALAFFTMLMVRHGDNKPEAKGVLESLDVDD